VTRIASAQRSESTIGVSPTAGSSYSADLDAVDVEFDGNRITVTLRGPR
jgi:hypothetical protein